MALSCKMELIRFPTLLRIQYIAECDKGTELHLGGGLRTCFLDDENNWGGD